MCLAADGKVCLDVEVQVTWRIVLLQIVVLSLPSLRILHQAPFLPHSVEIEDAWVLSSCYHEGSTHLFSKSSLIFHKWNGCLVHFGTALGLFHRLHIKSSAHLYVAEYAKRCRSQNMAWGFTWLVRQRCASWTYFPIIKSVTWTILQVEKYTICSELAEQAADSLGELFVACDLPEPPRNNSSFLKVIYV